MTPRVTAAFDILTIAKRLSITEGGAAPSELHVFAYLACLMWTYDGRDPSSWSYGFAATPAGAPYSPTLAEECDRLRAAGRLVDSREVLVVSEFGLRETDLLRPLSSFSSRYRYLEASCSVSTLLPLPSVADALSFEPQLQRALQSRATRELFKSAGLTLLEGHFAAVHELLRERSPDTSDLLIAATVWLTYLTVMGREAELAK